MQARLVLTCANIPPALSARLARGGAYEQREASKFTQRMGCRSGLLKTDCWHAAASLVGNAQTLLSQEGTRREKKYPPAPQAGPPPPPRGPKTSQPKPAAVAPRLDITANLCFSL